MREHPLHRGLGAGVPRRPGPRREPFAEPHSDELRDDVGIRLESALRARRVLRGVRRDLGNGGGSGVRRLRKLGLAGLEPHTPKRPEVDRLGHRHERIQLLGVQSYRGDVVPRTCTGSTSGNVAKRERRVAAPFAPVAVLNQSSTVSSAANRARHASKGTTGERCRAAPFFGFSFGDAATVRARRPLPLPLALRLDLPRVRRGVHGNLQREHVLAPAHVAHGAGNRARHLPRRQTQTASRTKRFPAPRAPAFPSGRARRFVPRASSPRAGAGSTPRRLVACRWRNSAWFLPTSCLNIRGATPEPRCFRTHPRAARAYRSVSRPTRQLGELRREILGWIRGSGFEDGSAPSKYRASTPGTSFST